MTASTRPLHPLDQPCPDCSHARWLHTTRCVAQRPGVNQFRFSPCGCRRAAGKFA